MNVGHDRGKIIGHLTRVWDEGGAVMCRGLVADRTRDGADALELAQLGSISRLSVEFLPVNPRTTAAPEGGRVGLTATAADGVLTIAVSDTGIGIAPEDQAAIFEEFRQVGPDGNGNREGSGLGLSLARRMVELHGGRLRVSSVLGQGATFTFDLPRTGWQQS